MLTLPGGNHVGVLYNLIHSLAHDDILPPPNPPVHTPPTDNTYRTIPTIENTTPFAGAIDVLTQYYGNLPSSPLSPRFIEISLHRQQGERTCTCHVAGGSHHCRLVRHRFMAVPVHPATPISNSGDGSGGLAPVKEEDMVNDRDRTKMCDWYYEMSDFLNIERATASRCVTLLDRFMAVPVHRHARSRSSATANAPSPATIAGVVVAASRHRDEYQLVALTALFLAIKLFERLHIRPEHVSYLSRGRYAADEVVAMEAVLLAALEWRVCRADKADYADALLRVAFPHLEGGEGDGEEDGEEAAAPHTDAEAEGGDRSDRSLLTKIRELANLQIQLSDFEHSFSQQRQSTVAFAAVLNAFEMKKDDIPLLHQHTFLDRVKSLIDRLYPTQQAREELARLVDRLRVLVEPSAAKSSNRHGNGNGNGSTPSRPVSPGEPLDRSGSTTNESRVEVSPLDVALESMESFDMAQLLCCRSTLDHDHNHAAMATDRDANQNDGLLETAASFGSLENHESGKSTAPKKQNHQSPTSIATILFGAGI